jgi:hypothetical protein
MLNEINLMLEPSIVKIQQKLHEMDVKPTFLNGQVEEEVYIE